MVLIVFSPDIVDLLAGRRFRLDTLATGRANSSVRGEFLSFEAIGQTEAAEGAGEPALVHRLRGEVPYAWGSGASVDADDERGHVADRPSSRRVSTLSAKGRYAPSLSSQA